MDPVVLFVFFFATKLVLVGGLVWISVSATLRFEELKRERAAREAGAGAAIPAGETTEPVAEPVPLRPAA